MILVNSPKVELYMKQKNLSLLISTYLTDPPSEPLNFKAESVSVFNVVLRWDPPASGSTEDLYYLLSYRLR